MRPGTLPHLHQVLSSKNLTREFWPPVEEKPLPSPSSPGTATSKTQDAHVFFSSVHFRKSASKPQAVGSLSQLELDRTRPSSGERGRSLLVRCGVKDEESTCFLEKTPLHTTSPSMLAIDATKVACCKTVSVELSWNLRMTWRTNGSEKLALHDSSRYHYTRKGARCMMHLIEKSRSRRAVHLHQLFQN